MKIYFIEWKYILSNENIFLSNENIFYRMKIYFYLSNENISISNCATFRQPYTACLGESNSFHSILLSQWHSSRSGKKRKKCADFCADFCEVGPKEGAIEQLFDLGLAATVKTKDLHGQCILKVAKTRIWNKLEAIWLFRQFKRASDQINWN